MRLLEETVLRKRATAFFSAAVVIVIFLFFWSSMLYILKSFDWNYSGFLRLRERRANQVPFLTDDLRHNLILKKESGYDGQFFYYMAYDPLLLRFRDEPERYRDVVDAPAYRYGRIGYPALTNLFSGGDPVRFPKTMILLILASHLVGAIFFVRIILLFEKSPLWALLYILIPGFSTSLNLALPESIASAFLLGGLYFYLRERIPLSSLFFSLSILTRETAIVFVLIIVLVELIQKRRWKIAAGIAVSLLPYAFWRCYLTWRLFGDYGWATLLYSPRDFTIPFRGIFDLYSGNWRKTTPDFGLYFFAVLVALNLIFSAILILGKRDIFRYSLLTYSVLHVSLNFTKIWGHIRNTERTSYEAFLFLVLTFIGLPKGNNPWIRYAFLLLFGLLFTYDAFYSSFETSFLAGFSLTRPFLGR